MRLSSIEEYIQGLNITHRYRGDCPVCYNKNTFSITRENGQLSWYCFHASCHLKGKTKDDVRIMDDVFTNSGCNSKHASNVMGNPRKILSYFTSSIGNNDVCEYLSRVGCYPIMTIFAHLIRYDPKLDRCVFLLQDLDGKICGAVGRSMSNQTPKWYVYERQDYCPFIVLNENSNKCIIVEDPPSACNVSRICNSVAILGTSCSPAIQPYLHPFEEVLIALDDDATSKSLKIQSMLSGICIRSKIIPIRKDLKYYSEDELALLKFLYGI